MPSDEHVVGTGAAASCTEAALRSALEAGGYVHFNCGDAPLTITVTSVIQVKKATIVDGESRVTLDGGKSNRILDVATNASLSVRNLGFTNGKAAASMEPEGIGGAIAGEWRSKVEVIGCTFEGNWAGRGGGAVAVWTGSALTIVSSRFVGNTSWYGGAVYSLLSPLTVVNSEFVDNEATTEGGLGDGGAIGTDGASESTEDDQGGAVAICGSKFTGNHGRGSGGAAYVWVYPPDTVLIDRVTASSNVNDEGGALGGAMRISNGAITVTKSTFASNTAKGNGGALYVDCEPTCSIVNSTFFGNHTNAYGGALFGSKAKFNNVTFAENVADGHGGALFGGGFEIDNSVFVDNDTGNPWGQARNCYETASGHDVLQWFSKGLNAGGDTCIAGPIVGDPLLSDLGDNGGPTPTMLPSAGSAALGKGKACEADDQRGTARSTDGCDLGAVEIE